MATSRWTADEERLLLAHYPRHGASWDGWAMLLPDRGPKAVRDKAERLGIERGMGGGGRQPTRMEDADIMRMFRNGFAPSRIDRVLGMREGYAHDAIVRQWGYEGGGSDPHSA